MENITRPSIKRLARSAGIKSISDDCFNIIRELINHKLKEIINTIIIVNSERQKKTIMSDDVYEAIHILGYNITQSNDLGTNTCAK